MVSRRKFIRLAAAGLQSALVPLAGCVKPLGQQRNATHFPTPDSPLTPTADWYFQSVQGAYEADLATYRLKVVGLVDRELSLAVGALRGEYPARREPITVACVGNPPQGGLLSSSLFAGVRVSDVLDAAGVSTRATGAIITGLDGFVAFQAMEDLRRPESTLAYDMGVSEDDLAPLPIDHGFPVRILTPGLYGYMQTKWIDSITLVDQGGYHDVARRSIDYLEGKIQLASGFSAPRGGAVLPAGDREVLGYAFGDGRAITRVEVEVDGGGWSPAEILYNLVEDPLPPYLWCLWRFRWSAAPGAHRLRCRATYAGGERQEDGRSFPYSGGSIASIDVSIEGGA